jgi:UDP:flavonoid glycosyltransferase YjiC (YdhE family)
VRRLGVARVVFPKHYRAERVARELAALLNDPGYRDQAAITAAVVREEGGAEAAADVIERLLA